MYYLDNITKVKKELSLGKRINILKYIDIKGIKQFILAHKIRNKKEFIGKLKKIGHRSDEYIKCKKNGIYFRYIEDVKVKYGNNNYIRYILPTSNIKSYFNNVDFILDTLSLNELQRKEKEEKGISAIDYIWFYTEESVFPEEPYSDLQEKAARIVMKNGVDILFMKDNEEGDDYITKHFLILNPFSIVSEEEIGYILDSIFNKGKQSSLNSF